MSTERNKGLELLDCLEAIIDNVVEYETNEDAVGKCYHFSRRYGKSEMVRRIQARKEESRKIDQQPLKV